MSQLKLFASSELADLYKKGQLQQVLRDFKKDINEKTFVGAGANASVFSYKHDKQVLKLVPINISYFKRYGEIGPHMGLRPAEQFKEHINSLGTYFLPIKDLLYQDDYVFIYTQDRCQKLRKNITPHIVIEFLQFIQYMLKRNIILTDLSSNNIGLTPQGHIILFDYHGLHPLKRDGRIHRVKWWGRLFRNFTKFITTIYAPDRADEYAGYAQTYDSSMIEKFVNDNKLPQSYIDLLDYITTHDNQVDLPTLYKLLQKCIDTILSGFQIDNKHLTHIKVMKNKIDGYTFF